MMRKLFFKIINQKISKIKGEKYVIDSKIAVIHLVFLLKSRLFMILRGRFSFIKNGGRLFIGKHVKLYAKSLMMFGSGVTINDNSLIDALSKGGVVFRDGVSVGKRTVIECSGSIKFLGKGMLVGNNVGLGRDCFYGCSGGIEIGDDTIIGNYVSFHSENHNYERTDLPIRLQGVNHKGIKVGKDCWIGAKATILDGASIEDGCIIAAGAVVIAGIYKSRGIYGGVPAKLLKMRN